MAKNKDTRTVIAEPISQKKNSLGKQTLKRLFSNKGAVVGLVIVIVIILLSIFAPLIAPYSITDMDMAYRFAGPSKEHWFGCDSTGRDILSRLLYGGRFSLQIGFIASGAAALLGIVIGSVSGYFGGKVDNIIMRILDIIQAIPGMLLSIAISAVLGNGLYETIIALAIGNLSTMSRVLRGSILSVRKSEYIDAAITDNSSHLRIIRKHILPNSIAPLIVQVTMGCAHVILTAATLSFIGLGVQPPDPEWGAMLSAGRDYIRDYPHLTLFPGLAIMLTVLSLNLLGDGLRDALDPKQKK